MTPPIAIPSTWPAASRWHSRNRTGCAVSATERSCGTGARACTAAGPAVGAGKRATCCARTAIIRTSRASKRWRPSRRRGRRSIRAQPQGRGPMETETNTPNMSRRMFTSCATAAAAGFVLTSCGPKRLYDVPREKLRQSIAEMERSYKEKRGMDVKISDAGPQPGVEFAYGLDLSRCIGCRRCVYACVEENNQSREPQLHWIRVLSMEKDKGVDLADADPYYNPETVPEEGHFYMPVACQQCHNSPCTKVCPTGATWQEKDGIVVVDYDWCI